MANNPNNSSIVNSLANSSTSNVIMKNETLKNMLQKLSEEAQKEFNNLNRNLSTPSNMVENFNIDGLDLNHNDNITDKNIGNFPNNLIHNYPSLNQGNNLGATNHSNLTNHFTPEKGGNDFLNNFLTGAQNKINIDNIPSATNNNDNFTEEFYMERYKNFIPSKFLTPSNFREKSITNSSNFETYMRVNDRGESHLLNSSNRKNKEDLPSSSLLIHIIQSKIKREKNSNRKLTFSNWIKIYNELNQGRSIGLSACMKKREQLRSGGEYSSVPDKLETFFKKYSFANQKEILILEVSSIKLVDCLQIITVKDYNLESKDILVVKEEEEFNSGVIKNIMSDSQFTPGEVILIKTKSLRDFKISSYSTLQADKILLTSMNNVKQLY